MKVLDFDKSLVPQETGYWCGPATVQSALKVLGINVAERDIARQTEALEGNVGWDDQDGTDSIEQLATVLNRYVGKFGAEYGVQLVFQDPPSLIQRENFWDAVKAGVDAGYGVPMNFDVPPNNVPRAQLGSRTPGFYYGNHTRHYTLATGYHQDVAGRYIRVTDSGGAPWEFWVTLEQCISLIAGKGYAPLVKIPDIDAPAVIEFVRAFLGPIASDVRDIRAQMVTEWPHLARSDVKTAAAKLLS